MRQWQRARVLRTGDQDLGADALANVADVPAAGRLAAVAVYAVVDREPVPAALNVL